MILNRLNLIVLIALIAIIIFLTSYLLFMQSKIDSLSSYKSMYELTLKENKVFQDEAGKWRNRAENAEVTVDNLKDLKELKNLSSEFKELKKNLKNLENYISINSQTTIEQTIKLKDSIVYKDSVAYNLPSFNFKNEWTTIRGVIDNGDVRLSIQNKDSLEVVQYWDRKWFLGKKKYLTEIKSNNPNTKISYQKNIKVKRKRGLF
jgi:spore coat polysaccharide biosynthesis protein SpsF (cytidylyltransferase family)